MAVWVVRGGHLEEEALESNLISIGFGIDEDLSGVLTREDLKQRIQQINQNATTNQIANWAGQVWRFKEHIQIQDLIVMPRKGQPTIAIGRMAREYVYLPDRSELSQGRTVQWINKEVSRDLLDPDLKSSLSGDATVFQPRAPNAEERLLAIAEGSKQEPVLEPPSGDDESIDFSVNLEEDANNRIRDYVGSHFHGHEFTRLVAAVLQAQGYATEVAPPGPDGGVDIVAGSGPMGFDPPRICVQVKSGVQTTKVNVLRELEGTLNSFGADYGLLV